MSWSLNTGTFRFEDSLEAIKGAEYLPQPDAPEACEEQVKAAKEAALELIGSRALVGPGKLVQVYASGHANPDHEPRPGWAADFVSVTVSQVIPDRTRTGGPSQPVNETDVPQTFQDLRVPDSIPEPALA